VGGMVMGMTKTFTIFICLSMIFFTLTPDQFLL